MLRAIGLVGAAALLVVATWGPADARAATRRAVRARTVLEGDAEFGAKGSIEAMHKFATPRRDERFVLTLRMKRLSRGETYSLFGQEPGDETGTLVPMPPYSVTAKGRRAAVRYDSTLGPLPFDSTLAELGGRLVQIRTAGGDVVLAGRIPELPSNE